MLMSQLYSSSPQTTANQILQNWYKLTNSDKQRLMTGVADRMKKNVPSPDIAKWLAFELGVTLVNFP